MSLKYLPPTRVQVERYGGIAIIETHPAYATISASRVQGIATLAGSEFKHHSLMTVTIQSAEKHRTLSRDWFFSRKTIAKVAMSEAQWAAFISTPNAGETPCTLEYVRTGDLEYVPRIELPKEEPGDLFEGDVKRRLEAALKGLEELGDQVPTKKLKEQVAEVYRQLADGVPYVAKAFHEDVEVTKEKARIEVEAMVTGAITRAGLKAVADGEVNLLGPASVSEEPAPVPEVSGNPEERTV